MPELPKLIIHIKLWCPHCGVRHVDESRNGERWDRRAHTTHRCQACGKDFDVYVSGAQDDVPIIKRCQAWSYPGRSSWDCELNLTGGRQCALDVNHDGPHELTKPPQVKA